MTEEAKLWEDVAPGQKKHFDLHIARLPTGSVVDVSVNVYRGKKDGPVLLLSGGLHGDEVNGIEIVRRLMENDSIHPKTGTVIAIPVLNIFGFLNFARDLPDGKDANRSFPGTRNGSLASRVAYNLKNKILPYIDYGIDFHTGGGNKHNFPQIRCDFTHKECLELADAIEAPFIVNTSPIANSLRNEAKSMGKCIVVYEGGEALRFDEESIQEGIACVQRLMYHLGMTRKKPRREKLHKPVYLHKATWVRAESAGLFHAERKPGSAVNEGDFIGYITDPYNKYRVEIQSPTKGYVIGLNYSPVIHAGDALVHIGSTSAGENA